MPIPVSLILLAIIALVLHISFNYLIPTPVSQPIRAVIAVLLIVLVLIFWFVLPVRIGG